MKVYVDGASQGKNGLSSYAFMIVDDNGKVIIKEGKVIGQGTNFLAEYMAVLRALEKAKELGLDNFTIYTDSKVLVEQIRGEAIVNAKHLLVLLKKIWNILRNFKNVNIEWIRRQDDNIKVVDRLSKMLIKLEEV